MKTITLFYSSVSSSMEIKKRQKRMRDILEMKKYQLELVDIALDSSARDRMREIAANKTALPPQLANGDVYCGGYDEFDLAVEDEILDQFLKIDVETTES